MHSLDVVSSTINNEDLAGSNLRQPHRNSTRLLRLLTIVASLGGFLFGFDTGVISGALPYLRDSMLVEYKSSPSRLAFIQEVIVVAAIIGAGIGSIVGGFVSDYIGRRNALTVSDVLFALGSALMGFATSPSHLIAGRALVGLGIGLASVTVPVFLAESVSAASRGRLVTFNVLAITFGQFAAYVSNFILSFLPGTWRWMLGIGIVPALCQLFGLTFLPESPRWLMNKGKIRQAEDAAARLGCSSELYSGLNESDEFLGGGRNNSSNKNNNNSTMWQLVALPKQLHLGIGVQILQQLCGINTVMYFLPVILQQAGVHSNRAALLFSMIPAAVNAGGTVIGMHCIERFGRRKLLLTSLIGVAAALVVLSLAFGSAERHSPMLVQGSMCGEVAVNQCSSCLKAGCGYCSGGGGFLEDPTIGTCLPIHTDDIDASSSCQTEFYVTGCPNNNILLILMAIILYLIAFSPGLGPVPWAIVSEIFPVNVRATGAGISAAANWIANAIVAQTFLTLMHTLGGGGVFLVYAFIAVPLGFCWVYLFLPETRGLSLEEVQHLFS